MHGIHIIRRYVIVKNKCDIQWVREILVQVPFFENFIYKNVNFVV